MASIESKPRAMTVKPQPQSYEPQEVEGATLVRPRLAGAPALDLDLPLEFFHVTVPQPCPYLPGRLERKVVTRLDGRNAKERHDQLARAGFRRTRDLVYCPACPGCTACLPIRVLAQEFVATRSLKRTMRNNGDLFVREREAVATEEQYRLFSAYLAQRHAGGDMTQMNHADYRAMVEDSPIESRIVEFRDRTMRLLAACLTDFVSDGLSAVYKFYDPGEAKRSLGTYAVLWHIARARELSLRYVYLGYWIPGSAKMAYKDRFRPFETLSQGIWRRHD